MNAGSFVTWKYPFSVPEKDIMDSSILFCWHFAVTISLMGLAYFFVNLFLFRNKDKSLQNSKSGSAKYCDIIFGTQTGNAKLFAEDLAQTLKAINWIVVVHDMKTLDDPEEYLKIQASKEKLCIFIVSTYIDGQPPENCHWFCKWLDEASCDFRISRVLLKGLKHCIFGLGSSLYEDNFNKVAIGIDEALRTLASTSVLPLVKADENAKTSLEDSYNIWKKDLKETLCRENMLKEETPENEQEKETISESSDEEEDVMDLEELGSAFTKKIPQLEDNNGPKEMITPLLRKALTKQGYKLLGSHSGVKMCRWTKSMLRGRGGCYKHTFYGIESHRCMEATPSLACANKCVFCWRHHTNPVGTEWKWKMDNPEEIVDLALKSHYSMIKEFKGVPGVKPERLSEGMEVKHCALSLVGEPIMYPEINTLIRLLHSKKISTFLVTNAQFPDAIENLDPVTQLYVSVDASNEQSLKKIDRPLFKDFWQRFIDSLQALSKKGQRTVYRLTLVKSWNTEEIKGYAKLVEIGKPDFIEIKGVTYCGTSNASNLTMNNVPWHEEVYSFALKLAESLSDYKIASEHEHSNCILIAHKKFYINGRWHTWIDYEKFHLLIKEFYESNRTKSFASVDYMYPTPEWAVIGSEERGFDPSETRFFRKTKKDISGC
ncbi:S-adenosyl-L-methionine-dependent tRNA 4-demethylwyosine synthase TYW1-like isoform X2 [Stegodyphus dumicola]|uniref:S-adenosyl-L-methionine-dependent tRNA 4-demethylwyosine synthase TYW1-like isoform X2 n=1 Tax=Stegodyphus dumicola TaxID=202533 RepID=UPI0015AC8B3C|nr:S-adenosyl-L-methionine-dependent tRNA 4-demethylwyosine synthase TYW1-like isoform X2 [Stegodyphus dumicola]